MKVKLGMITLILPVFLGACADMSVLEEVPAWERGSLARPEMAWEPDPMHAALRQHIYFSKEASSGAASAGGGGCGCN
ncbi:MAG: DUF4266 domain-containing protein [Hahellaceae bacterium]|nr:DUF4266 domain-containing protein [Hahellaceae bacterium]MCP5169129.1 DUF4266 domain-containing protein [Hahellaceae bacterium]